MQPFVFSDNPQYWFETLRALGHSSYGGSEAGEVVATAQRIRSGDDDSWHDEWRTTAERVAAAAAAAAAAGHPVSARDGMLRASTYYRAAEFFLHGNPDDPRVRHAYSRSVECFRQFASRATTSIEPVEIPYDGVTLQGYFYSGGDGRPPTLVMHNGFDGSVEEMHFFGAAAAAERGYHVLTFDGPGQPSARVRHGLPFRPDWEHVVGQVLDWLLDRTDVDATRIGLLGVSLGGFLAPRAAAFEPRLAACVAVDGVYDLGVLSTAQFPMPREMAEEVLRAPEAPEVDAALEEAMRSDPTSRWAMVHGCYVMSVDTPREFLASYLDYHLRDGIAEQIACPTLVCMAAGDAFFEGQPEALFAHLTCPAELLVFDAELGADAHCHVGAQRGAFGRILDWVDGVLTTTG